MLGIQDFWLFVAAGLLLNLTPEPDTAYIVARSLSDGLRGGVWAALGVGAGCLGHIALGAIGLSALLATSATAFTAVKLIGAAYLVYIGVRMLLWPTPPAVPAAIGATARMPGRAIFLQGLWTNLLNPKVALFFLAFLPQFIAADAASKTLAFVALGIVFDVNGTLFCLGIAALAARAARTLARRRNVLAAIERLLGAAMIALGARLALADRS